MFSDLVGSTALSTRLDPEDLRELIATYQKCVAKIVLRFGGYVAKYMGDGALVYFGYPLAHEDDAERAVRAGLDLIVAISNLKITEPLQTRVGIATGLVVVGDLIGSGTAQEQAVVGDTPAAVKRDLPIPASPESNTTCPSPIFTLDQRRSSKSSSSSRPMSCVRPLACRASKRPSSELGRSAAHARTGPAMPLRSCAPRFSRSNRWPRSFRVLSAMTTVFGSAMPCKRAAIKPDRPAPQQIAHHDPVSVTLADRNLINADHLRTRPARSRKLGFHVLLVEGLDRVPVQLQIRRYVLDCRGSTAAADI
jgi:Adenylate and Guanylate cyclase catalytic domain